MIGEFMLKEVMKYRSKGFLVSDKTVGNILRLCLMKMEQAGRTGDDYLKLIFKDELKNYCSAQSINVETVNRMEWGDEACALIA